MSYNAAVYREQGGKKLVIASSGEIEIQSGGSLDIQSGSSLSIATPIEVASGGTVSLASGSSMTFASGSGLALAAGSSFTCATNLEMTGAIQVNSAGTIAMATGSSCTFASGSGLVLESGSSASCATNLEIASGGSVAVASGGALTIASGGYQTVPYQTLGTSQVATPVTSYGVSLLTATTTGPVYTMSAPTAAGQFKEILLNPTSSGATHRAVILAGTTAGSIVHQSGSGNQITLATSYADRVRLISTSGTAWRVVDIGAVLDPTLSNKST